MNKRKFIGNRIKYLYGGQTDRRNHKIELKQKVVNAIIKVWK